VPFLLIHLGKEGYGLIALLGVIVSMSEVADLGLRGALGRELAEQVARKDRPAINELASTALLLYLAIASILAFLSWMLAPWLVEVFKVSAHLQRDAVWMIRIYSSVTFIFSFITPVFTAILSSYNRFDVVNTVRIIRGIASGLVLFAVIPVIDNALYGWTAVMLVFQAVAIVLMYVFYRRICEEVQIGVRFLNPARLRPLFKLGGNIYALQMTRALSERSDPLIISYFFGPIGVALYHPGARLSTLVRPFVYTLADQMYPLATKQHVNQQQQKMQRILILGTKYTVILGSLFTAGLLAFAEPFCRLWLEGTLGTDYQIAAQVMMLWALVDFLIYTTGTQWSVLLGMKKLKFLLWTQIPSSVLNIIVSIYLVGFTPMGIPGVLVATVIIGFIRRPILVAYTSKLCGLDPRAYFKKAYLRPLYCFTITLFVAILIRSLINIHSYFILGFCCCFVVAAWGLSCWFFGLTSEEKKQVFSVIMKQYKRSKNS
jgi:O-antigen/teichoic acid export membrane protein